MRSHWSGPARKPNLRSWPLSLLLAAAALALGLVVGCSDDESVVPTGTKPGGTSGTGVSKPSPTPTLYKITGAVADAAGKSDTLLSGPTGVAYAGLNKFYVADTVANRIRIYQDGIVSPLAGDNAGTAGFVDGASSIARFDQPSGVVVVGGVAYVADTNNNRIRKVDDRGVVSTVAGGNGTATGPGAARVDGAGIYAAFNHPVGLTVDADTGYLYVADSENHAIRRLDHVTGMVITVAGGTTGLVDATSSLEARFATPRGVAAGSGSIYVADTGNHLIRMIRGGWVTTYAGTGTSGTLDGATSSAQFSSPGALRLDGQGNLYVVDGGSHRVRKITPAGVVSTVAGSTQGYADGAGSTAMFNEPGALDLDSSGNLYLADKGNAGIRKIALSDGRVTTLVDNLASLDAATDSARFNRPTYMTFDPQGNLYVADAGNHQIRKITPKGEVLTLAGSTRGYSDGASTSAQFNTPGGLVVDGGGNLYVADTGNHRIRRIDSKGLVSTVAGGGEGYQDGTPSAARFKSPMGVVLDGQGNLYVADTRNSRIRKIATDGTVSTYAGSGASNGTSDGDLLTAGINQPVSLAIDATGSLYVAEDNLHRIRKIADGQVRTLAGAAYSSGLDDNLTPTLATFNLPTGLVIDAAGTVYVADTGNHRIRKIATTGRVTTLAGSDKGYAGGLGAVAKFSEPIGLALDPLTGYLYVGDSGNRRLRLIR